MTRNFLFIIFLLLASVFRLSAANIKWQATAECRSTAWTTYYYFNSDHMRAGDATITIFAYDDGTYRIANFAGVEGYDLQFQIDDYTDSDGNAAQRLHVLNCTDQNTAGNLSRVQTGLADYPRLGIYNNGSAYDYNMFNLDPEDGYINFCYAIGYTAEKPASGKYPYIGYCLVWNTAQLVKSGDVDLSGWDSDGNMVTISNPLGSELKTRSLYYLASKDLYIIPEYMGWGSGDLEFTIDPETQAINIQDVKCSYFFSSNGELYDMYFNGQSTDYLYLKCTYDANNDYYYSKYDAGSEVYFYAYSGDLARGFFYNLKLKDESTKAYTIDDLQKDADGYYLLDNLDDWKVFAQAVNEGATSLPARLTADISGVTENECLTTYDGHLDGQCHKLTVNINRIVEDAAPIYVLKDGGIVENLWTDGVITTNNRYACGICAEQYASTIRNCVVTITFNSTLSGDGTYGGFAGKVWTGSVYENCVFAGTYNASDAYSVTGINGYNRGGVSTLTNCLTVSPNSIAGNNNSFYICREKASANYSNCYYVANSFMQVGNSGATEVTMDQVKSGEVCYLLNGDQKEVKFYQNIGEDDFPVPFSSHKQVYANGYFTSEGKVIGSVSYANQENKTIVPNADLLDVTFNEDGTAIDVSAMANTIENYGSPTVVQSTTYGMNVFCAKDNTWFMSPQGAYRFSLSDNMRAAIQDGFSMELLIRPYWEGDAVPSSTFANAVGWEGGGGSGILCEDGTFRFETHAGGSYHTAVWQQAPQKVWTHMVGVWKADEGKAYFYVNGEQVAVNDAAGDYGWPSYGNLKAYIGADLGNDGGPERAVPGDYAIVRLYSDPLTADQIAVLYDEVKANDTGAEDHNDAGLNEDLPIDANGYAQISTADQLSKFAKQIKQGRQLNGRLMNDINYSGINENLSSEAFPFYGEFDGQGHTIKIDMHLNHGDSGLFDYLGNGCHIHDLHVDGTMHAVSDWSGVLFGDDQGATIEDVLITADLYTTDDDNTMDGLLGGYCKNSPSYKNVVVIGSVNADVATACCGFVADVKANNLTMENCVSICSINNVNSNDCGPIMSRVRSGYKMTCKNVYYVNVNNADYGDIYEGVSEITMEDVRSGRITAMLAGTDPDTPWRQTIGEDDYPTMDKSHGIVYLNGDEYVNVHGEIIPTDPQKDAEGYYLIGSPEEYLGFANLLSSGQIEATSNAKLTADIDLTNCIDYSIGNTENSYDGIFDGQFHTITLDMDVTTNNAAPFNRVGENSIIKNIKVNGTIKTSQPYAAGIVAHLYGGTIYKCSSSVKIICSCSGDVSSGGLVSIAEKGGTIKYCSFTGSLLTTNGSTNCGGLVGWCSDYTSIQGCIIAPEQVSSGMIEYTVSRNTSKAEVENCYYDSSKKLGTVNSGAQPMTASATVTGEMCFRLNGDQQDIGWTQNIGFDEMPNNEGLSSQVYSNIERRCDGKLIGSNASYSNDSSISSVIPDHKFTNGICSVCGQINETYMLPNSNGVYEVSTPQQLTWISIYINNGHPNVPICLKGDIDMSSYSNKFQLIGTDKIPYSSQFDGNLHRIKNLKIDRPSSNCVGFFGSVQAPCTISNLILDGTCSISGMSCCGMIGKTYPTQGEVHLSKLGNEGSVTASGTNAGGILGACMSSSATIFIDDCYVTGAVVGNSESAAITGWGGNNAVINNTWAVCPLSGYESKEKSFARYASLNLYNCYGSGVMASQVNEITQDMLSSGRLTSLLNGARIDVPVWFQDLKTQKYPSLEHTDYGIPLITDISQLYDNEYGDVTEGSVISNLIDGDASTYWHTDWHNLTHPDMEHHWLPVKFGNPISGNLVVLMTRRTTSNDHPSKMLVVGSNDGSNWENITEITLPYSGPGSIAESDPFTLSTPYSYLAFGATDCAGDSNYGYRTFWHAAEFQLYYYNPILSTSIALNTSKTTLQEGDNLTLSANITPENATYKSLTWNSSNTNVATVSNGVVTAVGVGTCTITATTMDGSNLSASCTVTVEPKKYVITYYADDTIYKSDNITSGSTITLPDAPVKDGYTFYRWNGVPEDGIMPEGDLTLTAVYAHTGDVNFDQKVNITDAVDIINDRLGYESEDFILKLSDVNADEQYTIADAIGVLNVMYGEPIGSKAIKRKVNGQSESLALYQSDDSSIALNMNSVNSYSAFQLDVELPDGAELNGVSINESRCKGFTVQYNKVDKNKYRIVAYNLANDPLATGDDGLLTFKVVGAKEDATVKVTNLHFSTQNAVDNAFEDMNLTTATGLQAIGSSSSDVEYNLSGMRVNKNYRGLIITNGKKIIKK